MALTVYISTGGNIAQVSPSNPGYPSLQRFRTTSNTSPKRLEVNTSNDYWCKDGLLLHKRPLVAGADLLSGSLRFFLLLLKMGDDIFPKEPQGVYRIFMSGGRGHL